MRAGDDHAEVRRPRWDRDAEDLLRAVERRRHRPVREDLGVPVRLTRAGFHACRPCTRRASATRSRAPSSAGTDTRSQNGTSRRSLPLVSTIGPTPLTGRGCGTASVTGRLPGTVTVAGTRISAGRPFAKLDRRRPVARTAARVGERDRAHVLARAARRGRTRPRRAWRARAAGRPGRDRSRPSRRAAVRRARSATRTRGRRCRRALPSPARASSPGALHEQRGGARDVRRGHARAREGRPVVGHGGEDPNARSGDVRLQAEGDRRGAGGREARQLVRRTRRGRGHRRDGDRRGRVAGRRHEPRPNSP